jgi:hypothetical protein
LNIWWCLLLLLLLLQYCECTDGSHIEVKASALVWHYGDADPDFGNWQVRTASSSRVEVLQCRNTMQHMCTPRNLAGRWGCRRCSTHPTFYSAPQLLPPAVCASINRSGWTTERQHGCNIAGV